MRPYLDYMNINGYSIPYPNDFSPSKVPNIVNEMVTLTGKVVADVNGWRYGDVSLAWDTLLDEDLNNLLAAISDPWFTITFKDIDGTEHTVNAVLKGRANVKTPIFYNGATVWKDVTVPLSFPDCYED